MNTDLRIIAVGARTPVGLDAASSAAAARAGISRVAEHPFVVDEGGTPLRLGRVPTIDPEILGPQRIVELAVAALSEAVLAVSEKATLPPSVPVFLALPNSRPGFGAAETQVVVRGVEAARIPAVTRIEVVPVVGGHAGGLLALEMAATRIMQRRAEMCLVGGADSYLDSDALDWLEADRRLSREGVRGGFLPGEGAGALVIAAPQGVARLRLPPLARIRSVASGQEPRSIDSDEGLLGEGLTDVVRRAAEGLRLPDERVDDIYCDINGERHRTDEWGFTILRAWQVFRDGTAYTTNVGNWGDLGAASAPVNCVLMVQAWRRGYASGPKAMIWGSSPEGPRAAAIFETEQS